MIVLLFIAAVCFLIIIFKFIFSPLRHRISLLIPIFVLFGAQRRRINCEQWTVESIDWDWTGKRDCRSYGSSKIWIFSRIRSYGPRPRLSKADLDL